MQHRILLVEDDAELREMVRRALVREGFEVTGRATGGDALRAVDHDVPDAVVPRRFPCPWRRKKFILPVGGLSLKCVWRVGCPR